MASTSRRILSSTWLSMYSSSAPTRLCALPTSRPALLHAPTLRKALPHFLDRLAIRLQPQAPCEVLELLYALHAQLQHHL
jgi:hypothetical protein